jgi:selenium-binding protein 1
MALEVRPAHDPVREYGFLGVVVDTTNLEGSIWTWWREGGKFHIEKTATFPSETASKDQLPPLPARIWRSTAAGDRHRPVHG